jgi:hypothetical protein
MQARTLCELDDPLLRRSLPAAGQAAAFRIRAGLLGVWLQLHVSSFRSVLARGWHALVGGSQSSGSHGSHTFGSHPVSVPL